MLVKVYALCAILCSSGLLAVPSPVIDTLASPLDLTERRLGPGGLPGGAKHYAASPKPRQATRNQIIARAKTSPRKRAESARPAVCSATFDATATQVALFEYSNWSFPVSAGRGVLSGLADCVEEVSTMPNGPFTTETCAARCVDMGELAPFMLF